MADIKINLGQKLRVKVNGSRVKLPYIVDKVVKIHKSHDEEVIVESHLGIKLIWDGYNFLQVEAPVSYKNKLCGLCGNYNNVWRDDLTSRTGINMSENEVRKFADSWRVGGYKPCARMPNEHVQRPQHCFNGKKKIVAKCHELKLHNFFGNCNSRVNPDKYFDFCKMDMCECPSQTCYCESFTAYAHECARNGVSLPQWRNDSNCILSQLYNRKVAKPEKTTNTRKHRNRWKGVRQKQQQHHHQTPELLHRQSIPKVLISGHRKPPPLQ